MAHPERDVSVPVDAPKALSTEKHREYLEHYGENVDSYEFAVAEYLRISGMYWTVTCLELLSALKCSQRFERGAVVAYVKSCQKPSGGFAPHPNHDEHLLHTLCAVQTLCTFDAVSEIDTGPVIRYVTSLQKEDGSFTGDKWGEVDTRFSMCGLACLALLHALDQCDTEKAVEFLKACQNFDGGFGTSPGSESHGAMIYCCVGSLAILRRLDIVDADKLGLWLAKRQLPSGGLNGRPEKLPDVCYSWWILASLAIIGRLDWIDKKKLISYILACQDTDLGGIADRPGNLADPFHTVFGTAGLSLLSSWSGDVNVAGDGDKDAVPLSSLRIVNPVFCMSQEIIDRLGIVVQGEPYVQYDTEREKWGGILITVMDTVCGLLEYRCQYVEVPVDGLANETLDGVMGALVNHTADVGVSSLGITIKRSEMFVLMDSMFPRSYYIIIHQDNLISVREYDFFAEAFRKLMSPTVLLVLAVVLVIMSIVGFFIDNWQGLGRLKIFSLVRLGALWIIKLIGMGLGIEGIEDFEVYRFRLWAPSKATFYATWFLYTTVVLSHVSSQLSVVFTFNTPQKVPFADVRSLYESNFTVYGTPTGIDMMNISQIPYHQKLASRIAPYPRPPGNVTQFQHYLNLSMMPRTALLMNQEALLNLTVLSCEMYLVIDDIGFLRVAGLVLPKGSDFQEGFERGFATAKERGVTAAGFQAYDHYLRTKTSGKVGTCYRKRVKDASLRLPAAQLGNDSFLFLLELLFYGMAVCSFAFFCEHLTQLCYRRKATVKPAMNHLL